MRSYYKIALSAAICLLMCSDYTQGMYSTNGTFIKIHKKNHSRHHKHRQYSLISLDEDYGDDEEVDMKLDEEGQQEPDGIEEAMFDKNTNNNQVELIVSDFSQEALAKKNTQQLSQAESDKVQEAKQNVQAQEDRIAIAEGQKLREIAQVKQEPEQLAERQKENNQDFAKFNQEWAANKQKERANDDDDGSYQQDYDFNKDNVTSYSKKVTDDLPARQQQLSSVASTKLVNKVMNYDDVINSKQTNADLWGDSDVAEFFNENSNRIMENKAPITAAQQDKVDENKSKENKKENVEQSVVRNKINDAVTAIKYSKIADQIKDEDSGVTQDNYNRQALSQDDDNNDVSEYYDFDD